MRSILDSGANEGIYLNSTPRAPAECEAFSIRALTEVSGLTVLQECPLARAPARGYLGAFHGKVRVGRESDQYGKECEAFLTRTLTEVSMQTVPQERPLTQVARWKCLSNSNQERPHGP